MKKTTALLLCVMMCAAVPAFAQGVNIAAFTPFADMDFAAQAYMDLITAWEEETGNFVTDYSGAADEDWLDQLLSVVSSGAADVVILPAGSGLTAKELVTAGELAAAAPDLGAKVFPSLAESNGDILLTPVRLNWEALYVNTDILAKYGLSVPSSLEDLAAACTVLAQNGVLPIANALYDWAEIVLDCLALAGAPQAEYGSNESFNGAKDALMMLSLVGAFGRETMDVTDDIMMDKFLAGEAAMRFDSDYLCYDISSELASVVTVIAPPARGGVMTDAAVGTPGVGLAISRSCLDDPARREAALSLCRKILASEALISPAGGMLGAGLMRLTREANDCTGLLYDMNPDGFDAWAASVVSGL